MPTKDLQRVSAGEASITGLPAIRWTSATGGNRSGVFGDPVFDPNKNSKVRLPGEATFGELTLTTAYSTTYAAALDAWLQKNKARTDVVIVSTIADLRYTFTGCSVASDDLFPGFDKSGNETAPKTLSITLSVGDRLPLG